YPHRSASRLFLSSLLTRPPPRSPLFPYTTLFRSGGIHLVPTNPPRTQREVARDLASAVGRPDVKVTTMPDPLLAVAGWFSPAMRDRKSTRLNSSHVSISYAVFCLKKKTKHNIKHN